MSKKLYITTAIPYVNGKPHIGNALDYLLADIWSRHNKKNGKEIRFQVGTDEHGNKIAVKAAEEGITPQLYADKNYKSFEDLMIKMKVSYTDFIRTTDPHHVGSVQYIWNKLLPHIYKGSYEGWYCDGCESFVTDKEAAANNGVCPDHKTPYKKLTEENYFLKMSDFTDQIKEAIETDRFKINPEFRKKEVLALIESGLPDISISRPKKNLSWGVHVPGDPTQVMYVWIDALANYVTVIGYPDRQEWQDYWPADVQVIGKDILRFHALTWPAILFGLDLSPPKTLLVHGHVHVGGAKMSKTVGNVVDPMELIDSYGLDAFRYYFSRHIGTTSDGDFTYEKFEKAYNNELGNDLGNLVQRVASMISKYQSGVVGNIELPEHDVFLYGEAMRNLRFSDAFDYIWTLVQGTNRYIERVKPWQIAKEAESNPDEKAHLDDVLAHAVGTIMQIASLMEPFLPDASERIKNVFESGVIQLPEGGIFPKIFIHTSPEQKGVTGAPVKPQAEPTNQQVNSASSQTPENSTSQVAQ